MSTLHHSKDHPILQFFSFNVFKAKVVKAAIVQIAQPKPLYNPRKQKTLCYSRMKENIVPLEKINTILLIFAQGKANVLDSSL